MAISARTAVAFIISLLALCASFMVAIIVTILVTREVATSSTEIDHSEV
jgi:hypothetical protein